MDIDIINIKLNIKYYKSIQKYLDKNNLDNEWVNKHIDILINKLQINKNSNTSENVNESESNKPNIESLNDKNLYKKPWSKLNPIHKILKIKEFINSPSLNFNSEQDRENIKNELISLVKTKVLSKKENVIYSETEGKILSIPNLQSKNGVFYYLSN